MKNTLQTFLAVLLVMGVCAAPLALNAFGQPVSPTEAQGNVPISGSTGTFSGDVTALSLTTTGKANGPSGISSSSVPTYLGGYSSSGAALWLSTQAPTSANYILSNFGPTDLNTVAGQVIQFQVAGVTKMTMSAAGLLTMAGFTSTNSSTMTGGASLTMSGNGLSPQFTCGGSSGDVCGIQSNIGAAAATSSQAAFKLYHINGALDATDLVFDTGDNATSKFKVDASGNATATNGFIGGYVAVTANNAPTNGIHLPAGNVVEVTSNGVGRVRVDSTGVYPTTDSAIPIGKVGNGFSSLTVATVTTGTGTATGAPNSSLCVNTTGVGNLGASGPDDLQSCTIPASTLVVTGRCFEVYAFGTTANNANAKTVRLTIGPTPTALITKQLNISVASTWKIEATICRTSASNQLFVAEAYNFGGTAVTSVEAATDYDEGATGTLTQTETNALVIKTQSTVSTTDNDIVSSLLIVKAL